MTYLKESELFFILNGSILLSLEFPLDTSHVGDISRNFVIGRKLVGSGSGLTNFDVGLKVTEASELCFVLHGIELALIEVIFHEVLVPLEHVFESSELCHFLFLILLIIMQTIDLLVKILSIRRNKNFNRSY